MSKPNGSRPIKRLAEALKPPPFDTEELAAALQESLDSAAERGAIRAKEEIRTEFGPRFDRIDETLRMVWKQCGGKKDERLPIDD